MSSQKTRSVRKGWTDLLHSLLLFLSVILALTSNIFSFRCFRNLLGLPALQNLDIAEKYARGNPWHRFPLRGRFEAPMPAQSTMGPPLSVVTMTTSATNRIYELYDIWLVINNWLNITYYGFLCRPPAAPHAANRIPHQKQKNGASS